MAAKYCIAVLVLCTVINIASCKNKNKVTKYIREEDASGSSVANMARIFSLRYDERPGRTFKLLSQKLVARKPSRSKTVDLVRVNNKTGVITLGEKLDREVLCEDSLECTVQIQAVMLPQQFFNMLNLELIIEDINDNPPRFPTSSFNVTVNEGEVTTDDVINIDQLQASDKDIGDNGKISYKLSPNPYFTVVQYEDEVGTSHLQLKVLKNPDHELIPSHQLTLTATDDGQDALSDKAIVNIYIEDANDHDPEFDKQEYEVSLEENLEASSLIATLHAFDQDSGNYGLVRYFISSSIVADKGKGEKLVSIDEMTGEVRLKQKLDREKHDGTRILIEARDSDPLKPRVGKAWLLIHVDDVNDNAPIISVNFIIDYKNHTAYLPESDEVRTYVAYVSSSDADNGLNGNVILKLRTLGRKYSGEFVEMNENFVLTSDGLIATGSPLDREICQEYLVEIEACDQGTPMRCTWKNITIIVLDVNDHAPKFDDVSSLEVTLAEDSDVGTIVTRVTATDEDSKYGPSLWKNQNNALETSPNGVVKYSIAEGDDTYFNIDPDTGNIYLRRTLDHEERNVWNLVIQARDGGQPSFYEANCSVKIRVDDVNDNPPVFVRPDTNDTNVYATILHDQLIMKVQAEDIDKGLNSKITYKIMVEDGVVLSSNKTNATFVINPITGELRLNFSNTNMTNTLGWHSILIKASDFGFPALSSTVLLNVKVTEKDLPSPVDRPALDPNFILIVGILVGSALLLILAIILILCCRRRRHKSLTYNCRTAESNNKAWITAKQNVANTGSDEMMEKFLSPDEKKCVTSGELKNARSDVIQSYDVIVTQSSNARDGRNQTEMVTFKSNEKTNTSSLLVLPVTQPYTDRDSGRGDSDQENGNYEHNGGALDAREQYHTQENEPEYKYENENTQMSDIGPRCDQSCLEYGHSDNCWMPSPTKDAMYQSHQPLPSQYIARTSMTSSAPQLDLYDPDVYPRQGTEYPTLPHYQTMRYYSDPRSGNYSSLPPPQAEYYYHGYGNELDTIEEVTGRPVLITDDLTTNDDVSRITHMALETASNISAPSGRNSDAQVGPGHRQASHDLQMPIVQYPDHGNWKSNYYNPPAIQRTMLPYETPARGSRLSSCSSESSSSRRSGPYTRGPPSSFDNSDLPDSSLRGRNPSGYISIPRLTPVPQLSQLNNEHGHPYYYNGDMGRHCSDTGAVSIQEAQEIVNDIDKLLVH